jgi:vacuolar-type H+-ATPase subunit H
MFAKDQDRMIRAAQEKAQAIVTEATSKHEELLDDHEIVRRARTTAEVVLREAEERARKVREGADHYAAQLLGELEGRLSNALGSVRKGRESLTPRPQAAAAPTQPLAEAAAKSKRAAFDAQAAQETSSMESVELVQ